MGSTMLSIFRSPEIYETDKCGICHGDFKEDKNCFLLKCGHVFHQTCFKTWDHHAVDKVCPFCRKEFVILPTTLEVLPDAARKSAIATGVIFAYMAAPLLAISAAVGLGYILKQGPDVIHALRNNLSSHNHLENILNQGSDFSSTIANYLIKIIGDIGNHLTSGTDPEILKNNPPLIDLSDPSDCALFLLALRAIAITVIAAGFLTKHCIHQYRMRDRNVTHIRYSGSPIEE